MISSKPIVVITTGDPAGIGPEVTAKAISRGALKGAADYIVIGATVTQRAMAKKPEAVGRVAFENIVKAVSLIEKINRPKALVTAPINKSAVKRAGFDFAGHTEILAHLTGVRSPVMMFSSGDFRLALVTRHIPLETVPAALTREKIVYTTRIFFEALRDRFGIKMPRIGICGLNPHAGDSGVIGDEEIRVIAPAVRGLNKISRGIIGPMPADKIFFDLRNKKLDGVVAMYHDQGLGPFKMLYFDRGVNVSLGLPFIRTSPDHGTAYDIAGKGIADPGSMIEAVKLAIRLAGKPGKIVDIKR